MTTTELTDTELRFVEWLPTNLSFADIGDRLRLPASTVRAVAIGVYRKLGVVNRHDAVRECIRSGLLKWQFVFGDERDGGRRPRLPAQRPDEDLQPVGRDRGEDPTDRRIDLTRHQIRRSSRGEVMAVADRLIGEFADRVPAGTVIRQLTVAREQLLADGVRDGVVAAAEAMARARLDALVPAPPAST